MIVSWNVDFVVGVVVIFGIFYVGIVCNVIVEEVILFGIICILIVEMNE